MVSLQWGRYIEAQLHGAQVLLDRADEILGSDPAALRAKAAAMLADGARKLGWELARHGVALRVGLFSPLEESQSLAA